MLESHIIASSKTVNALIEKSGVDKENVDHFVFHQANMMMNKMIAKKLKLPDTKVPYSLQQFGNTSSASIPAVALNGRKSIINS